MHIVKPNNALLLRNALLSYSKQEGRHEPHRRRRGRVCDKPLVNRALAWVARGRSSWSAPVGTLLRLGARRWAATTANYGFLHNSPKPLLSLRLSSFHGRNPPSPHTESTRCAGTWLFLFSRKSLWMEFDCIFLCSISSSTTSLNSRRLGIEIHIWFPFEMCGGSALWILKAPIHKSECSHVTQYVVCTQPGGSTGFGMSDYHVVDTIGHRIHTCSLHLCGRVTWSKPISPAQVHGNLQIITSVVDVCPHHYDSEELMVHVDLFCYDEQQCGQARQQKYE